MKKEILVTLVFSLMVGLGLGFSMGRNYLNVEPNTMQQTEMMKTELGESGQEYDLNFINSMIEHHQGAIEMANDAMMKSSRPEILKLSHEIIDAQSKEITQLEQWKKEWYGNR